MIRSVKTAVSLPEAVYRRAELLRRKARKSRSQLYANALESYFRVMEIREKEARYEAGYQAAPENLPEIEAGWKASARILPPEDW